MRTRHHAFVIGNRSKVFCKTSGLVLALSFVAQPAIAEEQAQPKFLIPILVAAITPVLQNGFGCLFERLFSFLGANPSPGCVQPNQTMVIQPGGFVQGQVYGQAPQNYMQPQVTGQAPQNYMQPQVTGQAPQNYMQPPPVYGQAPQNYMQPQVTGQASPNYMQPPPVAGQASPNYMQPPPVAGQASQNYLQPPAPGQAAQNSWQAPPPMQVAPLSSAQALQLAQTPLFSFIVNKLTDSSPQAAVKEAVQFRDVQQGAQNLSFNIQTGESFAILFATTVPGRVRMINTDVDRVVTSSDIYEAMPAADNRMPRDWQGGITMAGKKGIEYLDVDFTPCISQQYVSDPRVAQFQGVLPNCSQESTTKQYTPALASGKGGVLESGAKAMIFPASANPGQPVAMAPANYSKGGALTFRLTINHQ